MLHKILILAAAILAASILLNHFFNGADIDWANMLILALVIGHNVRELQWDKIKEYYETTFVTLMSFRDAVFAECDDETIDRISIKVSDITIDTAPEELQPELRKANELLKKIHKLKYGADKNEN